MDRTVNTDVVVVGGGNAGLSAAVAAREAGARVTLLEKAPRDLRGGNTYFVGDLRFPWTKLEQLFPLVPNLSEHEKKELREAAKPYTHADFYDDAMGVTEGRCDPELLDLLVNDAYPTIEWMAGLGHTWYPAHHEPGHSVVVRLNGGGAKLSDVWFSVAEAKGVDVRYGHAVFDFILDGDENVAGVRARTPNGVANIHAKAVILACGGFEANPAMRAAYLGKRWDLVKVRGVPFNTGDGLRMALEQGAAPAGNWSGCHASPQDMNRPPHSLRVGGEAVEYRRYGYPYGIMVNEHGLRFVDEGSDMRAYTYAKTGEAIMNQPQGVAWQIYDRKTVHLLSGYGKATGSQAATIAELAHAQGIEPQTLVRTVEAFNKACQPGAFNPMARDSKHTVGLEINKSNWAVPIDEPPFHAYAVVCGITFTYGGLKIDRKTQVISTSGAPIPNLFACGETVGGLWYANYPGGSGMMQGAAFGRIAGGQAAALARAA